jgi:predicted ribosome quality control (RQC) complex YloA/Tae2 family protein
MDSTVLARFARELRRELAGTPLRDVGGLPGPGLYLAFPARGTNRALLVTAEPGAPRLEFLASFRPPRRPDPYGAPFANALRGARLTGVDTRPWERLLRLRFAVTPGFGAEVRFHLILELIPMRPALFLVDEENRIRARLRPGRHRDTRNGEIFQVPTRPALPTPEAVDRERLARTLSEGAPTPIAAKLRVVAFGLTPRLLEEIAHRAGLADADAPPVPPPGALDTLDRAWKDVVGEAMSEKGRARLYLPRTGAGRAELALVELGHLAGTHELREFDSVTEALGAYWRAREDAREAERETRRLRALLATARRRAESLRDGLERDLARAEADRAGRRLGEALLAHLRSVPAGVSEAELPDDHDPSGGTVRVPLDPALNAEANAERYFRRARKAGRALRRIPERMSEVNGVLARLGSLESALEVSLASGDDGGSLAARVRSLRERAERDLGRLGQRGAVARPAPPGIGDAEGERLLRRLRSAGIRPRQIALAPGWILLVGRTSRENDILTTRVAAPYDLWFHARGVGGSHVVLLRPGRKSEPPPGVVEKAARAAAFYSQGRTSGLVPVAYTEARHVRKPRGAPPGLVVMVREKVLMVAPEKPAEVGAVEGDRPGS